MFENHQSHQGEPDEITTVAQAQIANGTLGLSQELTSAQQGLPVRQLIDLLARALDRELQTLKQNGATAIKSEDLSAAVTNLRRAVKVRALRDSLQSLKTDWDSLKPTWQGGLPNSARCDGIKELAQIDQILTIG